MVNHIQIVIHFNANQIWNMLRRQTHDKHNKQQEEKLAQIVWMERQKQIQIYLTNT